MKERDPRFTVVIPCHRGGERLRKAVDSVLRQSFEGFEVLVVDDGSETRVSTFLEDFTDPRLRLVRQAHEGVSAARNRGIDLAHGQYVTFLDSDDLAHSDWLSGYTELLGPHPPAVLCSGLRVVDDRTGKELKTVLPAAGGNLFLDHKVLFLAGSFAVRRDFLRAIGGYRESLAYSENTDLGIRLVEKCVESRERIACVERALVTYRLRRRRDPRETTSRQRSRLRAIEYFLEVHAERLQRDRSQMESYLSLAGVTAVRAGLPHEARRFFLDAVRCNPWRLKNHVRLAISFLPRVPVWLWKS